MPEPCARSSTTAAASRSSCSIERDGDEQTVSVTPKETEIDGETLWLIGITLMNDYDFPIDVDDPARTTSAARAPA